MAAQVAGDLYESITGQLFEIARQLRQHNGYPFNPEALKAHLQNAIEGRLNGAVAQAKKLLLLVATVSVAACEKFVAEEYFKADTKKAAVRIYDLGGNFEKHFGRKVEGASEAVELKVHKLLEGSSDFPIITELADKFEITLGQFLHSLSKQVESGSGPFLTSGLANVAYIRDNEAVLWAVRAFWTAGPGDWHVQAFPIGDPRGWLDGNLFLSR